MCVCGVCVCHLANHTELTLLTMLPGLRSEFDYDIVQGEAALGRIQPYTARAGNYQQP